MGGGAVRRRRGWTALLLAVLTLFLAACGGEGEKTREEKSFALLVDNRCGEGLCGVYVEYALGEEAAGGQMVYLDADLTVPLPEEPICLAFTDRDLSSGADLERFQFDLWAVLEGGAQIQAGETVSLPAEWGETYAFQLSQEGDAFCLAAMESMESE